MSRVSVLQQDITTVEVDAIVNAANERMLGGGGVDGAIHRAAGRELLRACEEIPEVRPGVRCPTGEARITPAFDLPATYVIHTVGPVWSGGDAGVPELLARCYSNTLALAGAHDVRTIAFPAISCGVYGYPFPAAAEIAATTIAKALAEGAKFERVLLVAFNGSASDVLETALSNVEGQYGGPIALRRHSKYSG